MAGSSSASRATPLLLLLLLLGVAARAAAAARAGAVAVASGEEGGEKFLPLPLPLGGTGIFDLGQISGCWTPFVGVPGCFAELMGSFLTARLQLGAECCRLIDEVDDRCFLRVFANAPFSPFDPPAAIRSYCAAAVAAVAAPAVPPPPAA